VNDAKKLPLIHAAAITLFILAAYCNIFSHGFVWDDAFVIVDNPLLDSLKNIPALFLYEDKFDFSSGYYRPITYVSFVIDHAIWGLNPLGYNLTNLILHIEVALAFYLVVRELFKKEWYAFIAALLFSLHPIANETVNFHAGGRNTLLCAFFALLSFFFHMRKKYSAAVACFILAIFSKEFALLMPVLFLINDKLLTDEKVPLKRYVSYIGAMIGYLIVRSYVVTSANVLAQLQIKNILLLTPRLITGYLSNMVLPVRPPWRYFDGRPVRLLFFHGICPGACLCHWPGTEKDCHCRHGDALCLVWID